MERYYSGFDDGVHARRNVNNTFNVNNVPEYTQNL